MRNAYEPPPWLAALNTPAVQGATGLGTGGGASLFTTDSGGFGDIRLFAGPGFTAAGSVALAFPNAPPTLFISGANDFGPLTQATVGNVVTISWTAFAPKSPGGTKAYDIHYEWSVST